MRDDREPAPVFLQGDAAALPLRDRSVDVIVTSPPYNVGGDRRWRTRGTAAGRDGPSETTGKGAGAGGMLDGRRETAYRAWQQQVLNECHRVATAGTSLFYVHRVRISDGELTHPVQWLRSDENPWLLRQELVWRHRVRRENERSLFNPVDERVYWLTKGRPRYADPGIQQDSVWEFTGSRADTSHPTAFPEELPRRCLEAVATDGDVVLDPMAGSMTTCRVASALGYRSIGVEVDRRYIPGTG